MSLYKISTLGCKVNQYESEAIAECLNEAGWQRAGSKPSADVCIINTCTVTGKASMQSRQAIRQIIKNNPDARIVVTGCYAQTEAEEIRKIEGVSDVISHSDKHKIPGAILSALGGSPLLPEQHEKGKACKDIIFRQIPATAKGVRTRPFLKIQDGCNSFCTYCIVPYTRGRSRSMPFANVMEKLSLLREAGYKEVVLTGIHVGCYGEDLSPKTSLYNLFRQIHETSAIGRLRLSSIEPKELGEDIIDLVASSDRFCNHFHIPLQSGDDEILKRMHRPYDSRVFTDLVETIHSKIEDAAIGADILVGFPGESEESFQNTCEVLKNSPITYLHVFPYSPRKGTPASTYPDQIPADIMKERCSIVRSIGQDKKRTFMEKHIGKPVEVLIENKRDKSTGMLKGITSNYLTVLTEGGDEYKNSFVTVKIEKFLNENSLTGEML